MYLIPEPKEMKWGEGEFWLREGTVIALDSSLPERSYRQAARFARQAGEILGYELMLVRGQGRKGDLILRAEGAVKGTVPGTGGHAPEPAEDEPGTGAEGYRLRIGCEGVELVGPPGGLLHGLQTLLQIISQEGARLPALEIWDEPVIPNRGFYFDCSRGRVPRLDWLKGLADRMAYYKLNQLQLYIEHTYLFRGMTELWRDDTPLTAAEILELDDYCADRGIELVPSLSSFGHLHRLLSSRSYAHLCELENSVGQPFSVRNRQFHHTIDASNPESLSLIKSMIGEYMELFRSRKFNFCADETFDLGTGRSRAKAQEVGKERLYMDYIISLAEFLTEHGRQPMFWGDIIRDFPERIKELPGQIVCLNWGYRPEITEEPMRRMQEAGAVQYCCPGCSSWARLAPAQRDAYQNITRHCRFAVKYGAIGLLNTDWGDYYHINHPDISRAGMIYGAAFSWNPQILPFEEINRRISRLEYGDRTESFLEIVCGIQDQASIDWWSLCHFQESRQGILTREEFDEREISASRERLEQTEEKNAKLREILYTLYGHLKEIAPQKRRAVIPYLTAAEGLMLWNQVGKVLGSREYGMDFCALPDAWKLAEELEAWLYRYKQHYRQVSKEGELKRLEAFVCWYGDYLRAGE